MRKAKIAKTRTIYNNYNLWEDYEEFARETLEEYKEKEEITNDDIWNEIYEQDASNWEDEKARLVDFFDGSTWILQGYAGCWDGRHKGGYVFTDFEDMWYKATEDCDYYHIYDKNGHLFLQCSHHDGTNLYEIKKVTEKGEKYLENWEDNWSDMRSKEYVHDKIMEKYSVLPHFAHNVYGCPKMEYEKETA